jgi:predicted kinase
LSPAHTGPGLEVAVIVTGKGDPMAENPVPTTQNQRKIQLLRPSVVVLVGPSGSGKSTFAEYHFRPTQIISSDQARALVCDDEADQRYNTQAFALLHFLAETRLASNRLCVVDSTAITAQARRDLLQIAHKMQVPCVALLFNVTLPTCLQRDEKRSRRVGQAIIERQFRMYEEARASIRQEGFDQVIDLSDDDTENVDIEIRFRPVQRPNGKAEVRPPNGRSLVGADDRDRPYSHEVRPPRRTFAPAPNVTADSPTAGAVKVPVPSAPPKQVETASTETPAEDASSPPAPPPVRSVSYTQEKH